MRSCLGFWAGLIFSVLALMGTTAATYSSVTSQIATNTVKIVDNEKADIVRQTEIKEDLNELKDSDKEIQRLLRQLIRQIPEEE